FGMLRRGDSRSGDPPRAGRCERGGSGEQFLEEGHPSSPGAFVLLLLLAARTEHGPAVSGPGACLDLRGKALLAGRLATRVLRLGLALVVVLRDRDQEARAHARDQEMRAVLVLRHETAAVERAACADTLGHRGRGAHHDRTAHAVADRADLTVLVDGVLLI